MFKVISVLSVLVATAYGGMDCTLGSGNAVEKFLKQCPSLLDSPEYKYCCPTGTDAFNCCTLGEFILQWLNVMWPYILLVLVACFILSCACCCIRKICC